MHSPPNKYSTARPPVCACQDHPGQCQSHPQGTWTRPKLPCGTIIFNHLGGHTPNLPRSPAYITNHTKVTPLEIPPQTPLRSRLRKQDPVTMAIHQYH